MATGRGTRPVLSEGRRLAAGGGGIQTREGTEAFARALHQPFPQILVSTEDLAPRLARHRALHEVPPTAAGLEAPARHPRPALAVPYVAPRDEVEQAVADIWQDLLGFEPVGIEDDFFDLGGHSLLAMQVVNRIRQTFGLPLRLQALFDAPTVAELSRVIVGQEARPGEAREIARITREVARLPGDEVERLLQEEGAAGGNA
jgi:acyl carrier protein